MELKESKPVSKPPQRSYVHCSEHEIPASKIGAYIVEPSGKEVQVAWVWYCPMSYWDNALHGHRYCERIILEPRWFACAPPALKAVWSSIQFGGLSAWYHSGFHVVLISTGGYASFNSVHCVPLFKDISELEPMAQQTLAFRARHDPTLTDALKLKLSGLSVAPAKVEETKRVLNKIVAEVKGAEHGAKHTTALGDKLGKVELPQRPVSPAIARSSGRDRRAVTRAPKTRAKS